MDVLRNILYMARRFKVATALNFVCLVLAFVVFYFLMTQINYESTYNHGIKDYDKIYRLELTTDLTTNSRQVPICRPVAEQIATLPHVESMGLMWFVNDDVWLKKEDSMVKSEVCLVNDDMFKTFSAKMIDGNADYTEQDWEGIIIPASLAMAYFGTTQAAGKIIEPKKGNTKMVRGVYEDFPDNCFLRNVIYANLGDENKDDFSNFNYAAFYKMKDGTDMENFSKSAKEVFVKMYLGILENMGEAVTEEEKKDVESTGLVLTPLTDTYFSGVDRVNDKGNPTAMLMLRLAALLMILVAAVNFLNFTLSESPVRLRNINTRKVLGASGTSLRTSLVAESVIISLVACLVGIMVCAVLSYHPWVQDMFQGSLKIKAHYPLVAMMLMISVVLGIVVGFYPAVYVTSFPPAVVLKGSYGLSPKGKQLRNALMFLQLCISSVLLIFVFVLFLQSRFINNLDYGYDKDRILSLQLLGDVQQRTSSYKEVEKIPGVESISLSYFLMGTTDQYMEWERGDGVHHVHFVCMPVDRKYLSTMGVKIIEGRDFNDHDAFGSYIINKAAKQQWGWVRTGGKLLNNDETVVGVCDNIRFASTRIDNNVPMAFCLFNGGIPILNIRISDGVDKADMKNRILKALHDNNVSEVTSLDTMVDLTYKDEHRFMKQILVFSLICMALTLIGVFCMTMFETEYRRKEIGIRKVLGSTTKEILQLICKHYVILTIISFVIAAPVAYYVSARWLENFHDRTSIYWWIFPLALLVVSAVTLVTVILQSWKSANDNPVNSIRTE